MQVLEVRFLALEAEHADYDAAVLEFQTLALARINQVLAPLFAQAQALTSLGALLSAHSATSLPVQLGTAEFEIDAGQIGTFAFSHWMTAAADDESAAMSGYVSSYDRETGLLTVSISESYGSGSHTGWVLSPSTPPLLAAAVVDGGTYDGIPSAGSLPYQYVPTAEPSDGGSF